MSDRDRHWSRRHEFRTVKLIEECSREVGSEDVNLVLVVIVGIDDVGLRDIRQMRSFLP